MCYHRVLKPISSLYLTMTTICIMKCSHLFPCLFFISYASRYPLSLYQTSSSDLPTRVSLPLSFFLFFFSSSPFLHLSFDVFLSPLTSYYILSSFTSFLPYLLPSILPSFLPYLLPTDLTSLSAFQQ